MTTIEHGGALRAAQSRYPDAPKPWIDLSTGINPVPYPVDDIAPQVFVRLPERDDVLALEAVAAKAYGVPDPDCIVAAPGVQSLIQLMPMMFPAKSVAVLGPTYEEHALCWRRAGARVCATKEIGDLTGADVAVIVNPNNPDGRIVTRDDLARIDAKLLVVDESFAEVIPAAASLAPYAQDRRAIVLRSFGKFFGLAGLRLGFAVAPRTIADRLRDALGPWSVSGPAIAIGTRALADESWKTTARARLATDARRLDAILSRHGLNLVGGTDLFRLTAHEHAVPLHRRLCEYGVLTRIFAHEPTLIRFGLPGASAEEWRRVEVALAQGPTAR